MGKILDDFMNRHDMDDGQVLAMIGDAALQIIEPDLSIEHIKKNPPSDSVKKEAREIVNDAAFAVLEALAERFLGGKE